MRVGGILRGRRPPKAGGGPMLRAAASPRRGLAAARKESLSWEIVLDH
jgi:hypothetical protein